MSSTKRSYGLFEKRMKVCEDVAEYKIHTGKQVLGSEERTGQD